MKKLYSICLVILICIGSVSCRHRETYRLLNKETQIAGISLVLVSFDEQGNSVQTELKTIENKESFLEDFRKVDCYSHSGDPMGVTEEGVEDIVIKVCYNNDEYELINCSGQATYTAERGFRFYRGYSVFDKEQFDILINKYMAD